MITFQLDSKCDYCEFKPLCESRGYITDRYDYSNCEHYDAYMEAKKIVEQNLIYVEGEVK